MKRITTILLAAAGFLLVVPAVFAGSTAFALVAILITGASILMLRTWPDSNLSGIPLVAMSAQAVFALFLGIHPLFSVVALMLSVYAWNAGNRFAHLDRAPMGDEAKRQFVIQILTAAIIPSFAVGLFLTAFLYVRFTLPFGLGLALSSAVLLTIAAFMVIVHKARPRDD